MQEFIDNDNFTRKEGLSFLRDQLKKYEARKIFTTNKILKSNIEKIAKLADLNNYEKEIESLSNLTPGDFAAVLRQNRFNSIEDSKDFYERLKSEVEVKNIDSSKKLGFMLDKLI